MKSGDLSLNIPISNSFINEKNRKNFEINLKNKIPRIIINSPVVSNKRKMNQQKEESNLLNKLNYYFSYNKDINKDNNNENKYMKKINIKSYKQKLKSLQNDNFIEKRERYGSIYEREKKEEKENKKTGNEIILTNKSNEFAKRIKHLDNKEENQFLSCYLSPKNNSNSQIFNNFYSINLPAPVKVINVFKK